MRRVPDPLVVSARRRPERAALIGPERTLTHRQLADQVRLLRAALRARGIEPGDRVATLLPRTTDHAALLLAVLRVPAVAVPLSTRWPAGSRRRALDRLRPSALLMGDTDAEAPRPGADLRVLRPEDLTDVTFEGDPPPLPVHVDLDRPATVLHTSGSTGRPRAVLHDRSAHYFSARGANAHLPLARGDRWLLSLPLYHVGGLAVLTRCLLAGAAVVVPEVGPSLGMQLRGRDVTHCSLVSTQLRRLLEEESRVPDALEAVLLGGGPIPRSLLQRAREAGWPVHPTYGATETASQVTTTPVPAAIGPVTAGTVLPYRRVRLAESGEIEVGGRILLTGYLTPDGGTDRPDREGWFPTGDYGSWTEDGELRVLGRSDDRFVSGGENVHPREIERALEELPSIRRALVVPVPDEEYGTRPVAFVRWSEDPVSRSELRAMLEPRLPRFKHPDRLLPWPQEELDARSDTASIDRETLARRLEAQYAEGSEAGRSETDEGPTG